MPPSRSLVLALVLSSPAAWSDSPPPRPQTTPAALVEKPAEGGKTAPTPSTATPAPATNAATPTTPPPAATPTPAIPSQPPVAATPAERDKWLKARLDQILDAPDLARAHIGVAVAEVDSGRVVYARNDAALLNPASNTKLVTTAASLALLGPEFRFKTVLLADAVHAGVVDGNLYLKGFGDPSLVSEDLWKLVSDLAGQGVKKVSGNLVVDDSYFDDQRVGPGFEQKDEDYAFRAPNGAVSLNYNACAVRVAPGAKDGQPARITVEPASSYLTIVNEVKTIAKGKTDVSVTTREIAGHTEVKVVGTIKTGAEPRVEHRRIAHPDLYAGFSLKELLARRGIKLAGEVVAGAAPTGTRLLVAHYSQALGVLVRDVNKHSNNFMAEQLLKTLGAEAVGKPGTWQKGVDAVARFLDGLGIPKTRYKMTNGSGLYDSNRFTATQLITLLRTVYRDFRFASDFVGSLPLAGADGTIGHRMEGSSAERYVRAKTGTLAGVSCLSGYAGAPGHLPLAFAILMNDLPDSATGDARKAQDAIAEALVAYLGAPATATATK